ncbi:SGNH/GDSL hydrolase family protein [Nonomuraea sp. NN258]|uniref:SGNH/GDSL hydrolase family protein n=1 Tax=Nonomuraea antri TaxID=2730852 RepID=UPI001568EC86|nr:SGNH/GDSL hydrolase family protein [Nonomuraea antri]NRQ40359.1 SGNH/GDSL hydrolase family protein [Nonomuraea antri]
MWRRAGVRVAVAVALGAGLALAGVPLGAYERLACGALEIGCTGTRPPSAALPRLTRLSATQVALSGGYVALGDSYSSGEGVYDQSQAPLDSGAGQCHRSSGSYPPLIAGAHAFGGGAGFYACSGATTGQLLSGQYGHQPQITRVTAAASLVTLSIGGNDAGFTEVLTGCIVKLPWSSACVDQEAAVARRIADLRAGVLKVLRELHARAPRARVIVLGYPRPFPAQPPGPVDNLTEDDQRWLNAVTRRLNDRVGAVVKDFDRTLAALGAPGSAEYVDAYEAFTGHEVGRPEPYLHGLAMNLEELRVYPRSFHPTGPGYRRFAELITAQIAHGPGRPMNNFHITTP